MDIDEILEKYEIILKEDIRKYESADLMEKINSTYPDAKTYFRQAIKEIVKETLIMAAQDAELECRIYEKFAGKYSAENFGQEVCINTDERQYIGIDKDSITNVINKIKF